jgi:hypothetical protein
VKPLGSSLCAYILPAQAVSSLPDLLGHPSLQDIYLTLLIMVACFVVLYCEPLRKPKPSSRQPVISYTAPTGAHLVRTRPSNGLRKPKCALSTGLR